MTDKQIIDALGYCGIICDCSGCPKVHEGEACKGIAIDAINLINRLKAENERIEKAFELVNDKLVKVCDRIDKAKTEAYKEFAERAKEKAEQIGYDPVYGAQMYVSLDNIANISKEMVGEG